jgi:hypothetical protein
VVKATPIEEPSEQQMGYVSPAGAADMRPISVLDAAGSQRAEDDVLHILGSRGWLAFIGMSLVPRCRQS